MNIKNILLFYREKYRLDIDEAVIAAFAEYLEKETHTRPIPDFQDIIASEEAAEIFKTLLEKLQAAQISSQEKLASLEQITTKALTQLDQESFKKTKSFLQTNLEFINLIGYANKLKLFRCANLEQLRNFLSEIKAKALNIDYNSIFDMTAKSDLIKCALEIHSKICKQSLDSINGSAKFIHFYEQPSFISKSFHGNPRASEYLHAYGSEDDSADNIDFNKTSHGIGSGIYGVASLSAKAIAEQVDERFSQFCIIETKYPLRLSQTEASRYTEISKGLQEIGNLVKAKQIRAWGNGVKLSRKKALNSVVNENKGRLMQFATIINSLEPIKSREFTDQKIFDFLYSSLENFLEDARSKGNDIVPMPINYLVEILGFTGVVSPTNDRFSRGLIAMHFSDDPQLNTFARIAVKSLGQNENLFPNAGDSEDELTSDAPLPTRITIGGPSLFFPIKPQPPVMQNAVDGQENIFSKSPQTSYKEV